MKRIEKMLGGMIIVLILSGCKGSRKNIEEALLDITAPHPTENLSDFYELEGIRDERFSENDKGVWVVSTSMAYRDEANRYVDEGMHLWINRNYEVAEGEYYIKQFSDTGRITERETYEVEYKKDQLNIVNESNKTLQEKVKNFQFGVQYLNFQLDYLRSLDTLEVNYNGNVPNYSVMYELEEDDENLQNILTQYADYDISIKKPTLYISGSGNMDETGWNRRTLELLLNEEKEISLISTAVYNPGEER